MYVAATKPYEFIGLGAMEATKPYEFIWLGVIGVTNPNECLCSTVRDPLNPPLPETREEATVFRP